MITLFSFDYPPASGGVARLCAEVAQGLSRRTKVRVLSQIGDLAGNPPSAISEFRLTAPRPRRELAAWRLLRRSCRNDIVVAGIWYPEGLVALLAGCRRLVVLAHGSELLPPLRPWRRAIWMRLQRRVLTHAVLVIANSDYTARLAKAAAPNSRVCPIPLAVDHRQFAPGDRAAAREAFGVADPGTRIITSVSRLNRYKGHGTVFRALASLPHDVRSRFVYLIAGRGPDRAFLEQEATTFGVSDLVRWLGFVPERDLPDLYRASDLFCLCTEENPASREVEGFGLVFLEAQACGTPVVGTRTGGIPDAIHEGEGGCLIKADDAAELSALLRALDSAPDRFRQAGSDGRRRVERSCTWERYVDEFIAALEDAGLYCG